jgi:NAD(P)H-dependent flavin oxidoreductase YrpB (nitropropane dioxygenase family)
MKTTLCERHGIELPIIHAPMGGAVARALALAASNADGLGMLVLWRADIDTVSVGLVSKVKSVRHHRA